jgi:hypothetical protein
MSHTAPRCGECGSQKEPERRSRVQRSAYPGRAAGSLAVQVNFFLWSADVSAPRREALLLGCSSEPEGTDVERALPGSR